MDGDVGHFVLVPFPAQGHIIPMVDFGRVLAGRGMQVSLITTPFNLSRLQSTVDRIGKSGLSLDFISLKFPGKEVGLPKDCESVDVLPPSSDFERKTDFIVRFFKGVAMLAEPLEAYIRQNQQKNPNIPTIMITDFFNPWTRKISEKIGFPRFVFYSVCCYTLISDRIFSRGDLSGADDAISDLEVPRLTENMFFPLPEFEYMRSEVMDSDESADGILVNTFYELEPIFIERYRKMTGKKIWPVGPVSLCNKEIEDKAVRGSRSLVDDDKILDFLDSMAPKSVVYFSLGSMTMISVIQLKEIGKGLEAAGHPFIWVIRYDPDDPDDPDEVEEWLREDGLEERTKMRSLIIRGWAPQILILSHPSTGAFFTHCGWNSSLEGISFGVPMITWPCFADQFANGRFITEVAKIGVGIGVTEIIFLQNYTVECETIKKAVERMIDDGEEMRKRALDLSEAAKIAFDVGGSSHTNTSLFLQKSLTRVADS